MRRLLVVGIVVFVGFITSCGVDGDDGDSFIAYSWVGLPKALYTEDSAFGPTIFNEQYERATKGEHYMEYIAWDNSQWWASYQITVDEGESAELFADGADGDNLYFELFLSSIGPSFYTYTATSATSVSSRQEPIVILGAHSAVSTSSIKEEVQESDSSGDSIATANSFSFDATGTSISESYRIGGVTISIRYGQVE